MLAFRIKYRPIIIDKGYTIIIQAEQKLNKFMEILYGSIM